MIKVNKNDMNGTISCEKKYKLMICGTTDAFGKQFRNEELDLSNLSHDEINIVTGLLDAIFDEAGFTRLTGAELAPLNNKIQEK